MARVRLNPNFEREAEADPRYKAGILRAAAGVRRHVDQAHPEGGPGGASESVEVVQDRGRVLVAIQDPFGHLVEWGSLNNPPYAPLRRGARAAGLRVDETPKT